MTRSNIPTSYTVPVHHPGFLDDILSFHFDSVPIAADDVHLALINSLYYAALQLSGHSGDEHQIVKDENLKIDSPYYHLDIGSDLYADPRTFTLWHLKTVLSSIALLQNRYHLRECHFSYRTPQGPLLQGELRNPARAAPPRQPAADPHTENLFGGFIVYSHYGGAISFEAVATAMLSLLLDVWACMTQAGKPAQELHVPDDFYALESPFLRFYMRASDSHTFRVNYLLDVGYTIAIYGRAHGMRALFFSLTTRDEKRFVGRVVRMEARAGGDLTAF